MAVAAAAVVAARGDGCAAAGPAIFVNAGSVTTANSGANGSSATGGRFRRQQ